jgi:hypothetical protein
MALFVQSGYRGRRLAAGRHRTDETAEIGAIDDLLHISRPGCLRLGTVLAS